MADGECLGILDIIDSTLFIQEYHARLVEAVKRRTLDPSAVFGALQDARALMAAVFSEEIDGPHFPTLVSQDFRGIVSPARRSPGRRRINNVDLDVRGHIPTGRGKSAGSRGERDNCSEGKTGKTIHATPHHV